VIQRIPITDRASWLAMRADDLTASDIGAAIGVDKYKSALKLYAEKTGMVMPDPDNPAMRRGRWLEAAVLSAIAEQNPDWEIRPAKVYVRDPELRLGATPDAIAITDLPGVTNVQCKVVARPEFERSWADGPPLNYLLQTVTEGMLLGVDQSLLAALVIDTYTAELELYPVPRHEGAEAKVRDIATGFWSNIAKGLWPQLDKSRDAETITQMFPTEKKGEVVDLSHDNYLVELLQQRSTAKTIIAVEEQHVKEIETEIKAKLRDAEEARVPGWKITWKAQERAAYTVKASKSRPLRITEENAA